MKNREKKFKIYLIFYAIVWFMINILFYSIKGQLEGNMAALQVSNSNTYYPIALNFINGGYLWVFNLVSLLILVLLVCSFHRC